MTTKIEPLISVIIPTYNHANYLEQAIKSVFSQTYINWEIIVIDNYSTDDTTKILKYFTGIRVNILKIHNNGVIALSRNAGINIAKGEWIAFLDSDDWWLEDKLQTCVDEINDRVDLIYHYLKINSNKPRYFRKSTIKSHQVKSPVIIDLLVNGNSILNSSVLVRKNLLKKIGCIDERAEVIASEDYSTWLRISKLTDNFLCVPRTLGYYRVHLTNESSAKRKDMSVSDRIVVADFLDILNDEQKIKIEARFSYMKARFNYFNKNYIEAKESLLFSMLNHVNITFRIKSLVLLILILIKLLLIKTIHLNSTSR